MTEEVRCVLNNYLKKEKYKLNSKMQNKGTMLKNFKKRIKYHFQQVIRTKKSSHSIAFGVAIGTFISILPTPGVNLLLGLLVVLIYKKVNKYSLFGTLFFWNTLTLAPIYFLSYKIGDLIFSDLTVVKYDITILNNIYNFSRRFLVGNFITAIIISIASYFITKNTVDFYRKRRIKSS